MGVRNTHVILEKFREPLRIVTARERLATKSACGRSKTLSSE
jgi:hypothetical protein